MTDSPLDGALLDAAWDFADPTGSEQRLRSLRDELGASTLAGLEVTTQIARALGLQEQYASGHTLLDEVVSSHPILGARVALERGRLLNSSGDMDAAVPLFEASVELARIGGDDYLLVDGLHMLAITDVERSEEWTAQALTIVSSSSDARVQGWAGALLNNRAWQLHDAGELESALGTFQSALAAYEQSGTPMHVHIAHWSIARCLRSLDRNEEALAIQRRLQLEGQPDTFVDEEISILERKMNSFDA